MATIDYWLDGKIIQIDEDDPRAKALVLTEEEKTRAEKEKKELLEQEIRQDRNALLRETDWMANSDVTMSDEWKAYRQALRDITKHEKFPDTFDVESDFPTKPS